MAAIYEFIHKFTVKTPAPFPPQVWTVRVWAMCGRDFDPELRSQQLKTLHKASTDYFTDQVRNPRPPGATTHGLALDLGRYTSIVNAVEITDDEGQGCLVYPEWP